MFVWKKYFKILAGLKIISYLCIGNKKQLTTNDIMKKKFALCLVHTLVGDKYMIMDENDYCTAMCKCDIIFESDNFMEVSKENEKYTSR